MKSPFRQVFFLKCVFASCISFAALLFLAGCSHRPFAIAIHSHVSFEESANYAETNDGPTVDKTIPSSGVKKVVLGVGVGSAKITAGSSNGIRLHAVRKY